MTLPSPETATLPSAAVAIPRSIVTLESTIAPFTENDAAEGGESEAAVVGALLGAVEGAADGVAEGALEGAADLQ